MKRSVVIFGYGGIGKQRVDALEKLKWNYNTIGKIYVNDKFKKTKYDSVEIDKIFDIKPLLIVISTPNATSIEILSKLKEREPEDSDVLYLIEKPAWFSLWDLCRFKKLFNKVSNIYSGYNYRFYRGIKKLLHDYHCGFFGDIISVGASLEHGGSPNDVDSWKTKDIESLGCLHDLGVHLIDIIVNKMGILFRPEYGYASYGHWSSNPKILDDAFILGFYNDIKVKIKTSIISWKNNFEIKINGTRGTGIVSGRGGFYGIQTYDKYEKWEWAKGEPHSIYYDDCKDSLYDEMFDLLFNSGKRVASFDDIEKIFETYDICNEVLKGSNRCIKW